MRISPRYGGDPIIQLDGTPSAVAAPLLRQRGRAAELFTGLTEDQWAAPTRCDGWRVQDVAAHLATVDQFWDLSVQSGLAGEPTRFLADFDPKATPDALVDAVRHTAPAETLARYLEANRAFCATVGSLGPDDWVATAEAPPGHVSVAALAHHALWDSWVHERDVVLPLGLPATEVADEVVASLRYAAALGPCFALQRGGHRDGAIAVASDEPEASIVVRVGDHVTVSDGPAPAGALRLTGRAVDLLEGLSLRRPLPHAVPAEHAWLVAGLAEAFESAAG